MIEGLSLCWLIPCAIHDWRTRQVSNWLTLPAIALSLVVRVIGWSQSPWWLIILVTALALGLWYFDQLGGADAKGWIAFALLGERILLGAALGLLIWFVIFRALRLGTTRTPDKTGDATPGYPGYLLGVFMAFLPVMYRAYVN